MKRIAAIFAALILVALTLKAEHFTFMGIPIDGSYETVKAQLIKKGFTPNLDALETTPTSKLFTGSFAGYYPVFLEVTLSPKTKTVTAITAGFEATYDISEEYLHLCNSVESKYKIESVDDDEKGKFYWILNPNDNNIYGRISVYHDKTDNVLFVGYFDEANCIKLQAEQNEDI